MGKKREAVIGEEIVLSYVKRIQEMAGCWIEFLV